jgi:hypothetical protein
MGHAGMQQHLVLMTARLAGIALMLPLLADDRGLWER